MIEQPLSVLRHDSRTLAARAHLLDSARLKERVAEECLDSILRAADLIAASFHSGGKLLLCGNGGSAADCQHMAAEFVSRLNRDFDRPGLPAIALTTDTSFLTAFGNDVEFDGIFERQLLALGKRGDVLMGISTSGGSQNVIRAFMAARTAQVSTIALTGADGSLRHMASVPISVPSGNSQYLQEAHLAIEHILCDLVERRLFQREP